MNTLKIKNLFLRQSYKDAWTDYEKSLTKKYFIKWDYVILTASNEEQADAYRIQIESRLKQGLLPSSTHYAVLPDPDGKRVGSGGATFNVMKYIKEISDTKDCFQDKRILVIHSGGDSKRVPQYSACGKLFSPVPRQLPNGNRSTLFDELIISMSGIPSRIKDGMLVLSGDVLLLFNSLQIDFQFEGAAAISIKENVETGKNHGVFLSDDEGNVVKFLHKQSVEQLTKIGAVNSHANVDLDTGAIILDSNLLQSLFSLISINGELNTDKFSQFVNDKARISFYGDFLFPLAANATKEQYYKEKAEGSLCEELIECRSQIWDVLSQYKLKLLSVSPAQFIHFGTTRELLKLMVEEVSNYEFLDWNSKVITNDVRMLSYACNNAYLSEDSKLSPKCYIEDSYILGNSKVQSNCVISNVSIENRIIPEGITLHGLQLMDKRYVVRIYATNDNPKGTLEENADFMTLSLSEFLKRGKLKPEDLWDDMEHNIWFAKLYPVCNTMEEALDWALRLYEMGCKGENYSKEYLACERYSLFESFNQADVMSNIIWQRQLDQKIRIQQFIHLIESRQDIKKAAAVFGQVGLSANMKESLLSIANKSKLSTRMRIYYYLSKILTGQEEEELESECFQAICDTICDAMADKLTDEEHSSIQKEFVQIELPARINWGGGWSDTPPYCTEHGGTVLNSAIKLNGINPVTVTIRKIDKPCIILASTDSGAYQEFTSVCELQNCNDPFDAFALQKAALIASAIIPRKDKAELDSILTKLGGGFYLATKVIGIPRGSGLGTSSILAGACIKGLAEFLGTELTENELYTKVLYMEQIMSTGGGWQDQVGGLTAGIKLITTKPGIIQDIHAEHIHLEEKVLEELQERMALIYTGQRRLARNLLREVVGKYIGSDETSIEVLYEIQRVAVMMKFELEKGNIDAFTKLLNEHWELSKRLDAGCTNTCIDQIFLSCQDMIAGKMICGAGGGGFLQVILKKGYSKEDLRQRIRTVFQDSGVDVWDCELV
ncbi:fucose pyrophosphorylase domain-containing protein [Lachnotalea glycerini]|uniref:Bifunctional fucokinase/L-fucose-1-P-guanylyltransferase n=1 Tax=Lachnotalea glycerini TaxID=1763509 RepID=A0A371JGB1_9FIRM|nr:L-fucokinase [Lachnotalea glycerini]RDY31782.1 bifunctional fucokinase/L-fucose-1-P-guanylyltransferase [Lachnotalea glycerini]